MANLKISELVALTSGDPPVGDDVLAVVDNTGDPSQRQTKKVSVTDLILESTQTLTNKTLTSPAINTAVVSGGTVDNVVIGGTTAAAGTFTQVDIESQGDLRLQDSSGGEYVALQAPATATSYTLTMPTAVGSSGQVLETSDGSGTLAWVTRDVGDITGVTAGTNISITDPTGPVPTINVDNPVVANLTGDASGSSGSCTGNSATATLASTVTVTDSTANTEFPVVLHDESNALLDDTAAFTYNPSSSTVTATTFVGALTGNASGTAATVTGAAQTAITSVGTLTGLTTADLTVTGTSTTIGTVTSGIWGTGSVIAGTTMTLGSDDTGDVYYRASGGVLTRLGNSGGGDDDKVLTLASGLPTWAAAAGGGAAIDTAVTGATEGSVLFAGADAGDGGVLAQDNDKLFFDATNYRLGVGAGTSPLSAVDATTTGTGSTEYGVRGRAVGGATSNYGGYFEASGATNNVALATLGDENQFMNGSGTIKIYFDTALGRIGIGQATAASYSLEVTGTAYARDIAASANGVWGVVGTSATNHTTLIGLRGEVHDDVDVTTVGTGYAVYGYCEGNPVVQMGGYFATAGTQATSTNAYAVYGEVTQGPTDDAYGGYFTASDASSGGTTNAYGVKGLATGNATNNYGGYFKASNGTNDYGLIVASGDVGIGTELPDQLLDVRGNVSIGAQSASTGTFDLTSTTRNQIKVPANAGLEFHVGSVRAVSFLPYGGSFNVGIGTEVPTEKLHVVGGTILDGQVSHPVETTTASSATSVSYEIDFSKSNLQTWVLHADNKDLTLDDPVGMAAGRTVRLRIDTSAFPALETITLPDWVNYGTDITVPASADILIELTSWGATVEAVTADCKEAI